MDKPEPPKVVDLPATGPGKQLPKRFVMLLTGCRQQTQDFIAPLVDNLFGLVDDDLFECAEQAHSNSEQSIYFEAMRTLRLERSAIERRLHRAIAEHYNHFIEQRPESSSDLEPLDTSELSLIQRDEYEQVVIVTNLASHAEGLCNEILWALEQRLALLNHGVKLDHHSNPAAPRALVRSYTDSLAPLKLANEVLEVLHRLFQIEVLNNVEPLYTQLNQYLIDNNILPNLKYSTQGNRTITQGDQRLSHTETSEEAGALSDTVAPGPGEGTQIPGTPSMGPSSSANSAEQPEVPGFNATLASHGPQQSAQEAQQSLNLLHSITQLLGQRLHLSLPGDTPYPSVQTFTSAPTGSSSYSQEELLQALSRLQGQRSEQGEDQLEVPIPVTQVKQELVSQLEESSDTPLAVAEPDAELIDLVGMLFDFILDDEELPDHIKALLSHLHTPYLKIALADPELFESHAHPARQLLNLMARAACEWSDHNHNSQNIKQRIEHVVERVLQEFDEGCSLFEELFKEFDRFYKLLERQSAIVEQRAVEAAQGRDKLVSARLLADREVNQELGKQPLPETVVNFLRGPWTDVLVFSYLRHGPQSPVWGQATDALQQLCWSVLPKEGDQEQAELRRVQPELIHCLTELLSQLGGLQAHQIRDQLTPLVMLQKAAIGMAAEHETQAQAHGTGTSPLSRTRSAQQ